MLSALNDTDIAPGSALWLSVVPAVRIAIISDPLFHADFDDWERRCREKHCLAVEAMRWMDDASALARAKWSTTPPLLTDQETAAIDEARAIMRGRQHQ